MQFPATVPGCDMLQSTFEYVYVYIYMYMYVYIHMYVCM